MTGFNNMQHQIVGVINASPDSPKRESVATTPADAVRLARKYVKQGATFIDVGGRSSSADSEKISDAIERRRVLPVIRALVAEGIPVSIDTWSAATACAAVEAGATLVNFTGADLKPELVQMVISRGVRLSLMFMPYGDPYRMRKAPLTVPSMEDVIEFFHTRRDVVPSAQLIIDPNIGMLHPQMRVDRPLAMAWRVAMIAQLGALAALKRPIMLALPSRDGLGATRLWALLIARSPAMYVRTHHPRLVSEMVKALEGLECMAGRSQAIAR